MVHGVDATLRKPFEPEDAGPAFDGPVRLVPLVFDDPLRLVEATFDEPDRLVPRSDEARSGDPRSDDARFVVEASDNCNAFFTQVLTRIKIESSRVYKVSDFNDYPAVTNEIETLLKGFRRSNGIDDNIRSYIIE